MFICYLEPFEYSNNMKCQKLVLNIAEIYKGVYLLLS